VEGSLKVKKVNFIDCKSKYAKDLEKTGEGDLDWIDRLLWLGKHGGRFTPAEKKVRNIL